MDTLESIFVVMIVETQKGKGKKGQMLSDYTSEEREKLLMLIDKVMMQADTDPELREGLTFLEKRARLKNTSIYDEITEIIERDKMSQYLNSLEERFNTTKS